MNTLKQSFFLASSWFWCIGGFFPVLLVSVYGKIAFVPFFVFNVVGAAAFGFVLTQQRKIDFLKKFRPHSEFFSVVVACYQCIFIGFISALMQSFLPIIGFVVIVTLLWALKGKLSVISVGLFVLTMALFYMAESQPENANNVIKTNIDGYWHYIVPIALGFLLAPYFDLTFHRAYEQSDNPRLTFFVGFGVLFSIFLMGMYFAVPIISSLWMPNLEISSTSLWCIVSILTVQTAFTATSHLKELNNTFWLKKEIRIMLIAIVCLCISVHVLVAFLKQEELFLIGTFMYRSFLFIIGAVFPALLIFGGVNLYAKIAIVFLSVCYTFGFIVGGVWTPFLSVGMIGIIALYGMYRFSQNKKVTA